MLKRAKERGFEPEDVLMDGWYSGLENLKLIASFGWLFLTRLKSDRMVNKDGKGNVPISWVEIPEEGGSASSWFGVREGVSECLKRRRLRILGDE